MTDETKNRLKEFATLSKQVAVTVASMTPEEWERMGKYLEERWREEFLITKSIFEPPAISEAERVEKMDEVRRHIDAAIERRNRGGTPS
jgi:hypothetical protein